MRKIFLLILIVFLSGCTVERPKQPLNLNNLNWTIESELAQIAAFKAYDKAKADGIYLNNGPCLSNFLHGNPDYPETMWVLDIAHNPRTPLDDLPENQCSAYNEGKAKNFIEIDEAGHILTTYSPYLK